MRGLRGLAQLRTALLQHGAASRCATAGSSAEAAWQTFTRATIVTLARSGVWDQVGLGQRHADTQSALCEASRPFLRPAGGILTSSRG